jgi:hypothetical protein
MRYNAALVALAFLVSASPVLAHHISGTVYCDQDYDGVIDTPGDTPVIGVVARATSLDALPGQQLADGTDGSGFYYIPLPARTDRYRVELVGLAGGLSVVVPAGGAHVVQIITGTAQDSAENVNFLVQGCAPSSTSTTTTTTPVTTSTTIPVCNCPGTPFLVARDMKMNNYGTIAASIGSANPGGRLRLSKLVTMPDGSNAIADNVVISVGANVSRVLANWSFINPRAVVRDGMGAPTLPIQESLCAPLPPIACGTDLVVVPQSGSLGPLAPGTYGSLYLRNGASLTLAPGTFTFCDILMGRYATIETLGPATLNVAGDVRVGSSSRIGPASGSAPVRVNVAGRSIRLSQYAVGNAAFVGPAARMTFGRSAHLLGCFCADRAGSDKNVPLACPTL